jgi:RimJ/RimL family protein N-acetyltransferase
MSPSFRVPILRTARLTLRAIRAGDHGDLLALAHDADVMRWMHEGPPPTAGEVWSRMAGALGQWALRGYGIMVAEDREGFVGRLGFFHPYGADDPLLVYAIAARAWGKGYATEVVGTALDWIMETHRPRRIGSNIDPSNTASARVAQKLGAVREGATEWAGATLDVWAYYPKGGVEARMGSQD